MATHRALDGEWRAAPGDEELRRSYPDPDFDDSGWEPINVPGHWRTTPAFSTHDGSVLHRTRFETPAPFGPGVERMADADEPRRTWLLFDGIFNTSDVWLDGAYLGDTEGFFVPHEFEITGALDAQAEHTLALDVSCRPEADLRARRNLTGVFQQSDVVEPDWNPGGIWRPVRLEQTGPVRIRHFRAICTDATEEQATVFVRAVIDTIEARPVELVSWLEPHRAGPADPGAPRQRLEHVQAQPLAAGENRVEWQVPIAQPRLWWPHTLGDQPLYDLHVEVRVHGAGEAGDRPELVSDRRVRRMGLRRVACDNWIFTVNGERLFLKGSNLAPTRPDLAAATPEEIARDVALAKEANLDLLRVRAHVARPELYEAADEAGILLWQDLPLRGRYHRSVRKQARRQTRELVDLLAHHPSILLWCGHDDPVGSDGSTSFARTVLGQAVPRYTKSVVDHSIKAVLEKTDPSRPIVAHSGVLPHPPQLDGTDSHLWFGWHYGAAGDLGRALRWWPRLGRFVSAFGLAAGPDDESRQDQADLVKIQIETLRRLRYQPTGGFTQHFLADAFAGPRSAAVLDHDRRPRPAYEALRAACAPVIVVADPLPPSMRPGARLRVDLHVVSDARIAHRDMIVQAHLSQAGRPGTDPHPLRSRIWSWHGDLPPDTCQRIGTLDTVVPDAPGELVLHLDLRPAHAADDTGENQVENPAGTGAPNAQPETIRVRNSYRTHVVSLVGS